MNVREVEIAQLTPDPANPRKHGPKNLRSIKESLQRFGQVVPLVVSKGIVVGGNGTMSAMQELGWTKANVVDLDHLSEADRKLLGITLNRSAELAEWDYGILSDELRSLTELDTNIGTDILDGLGWEKFEIEPLLLSSWKSDPLSDDETEESKTSALHSAESVEWYTPIEFVEAARKVMGRIDLDPASCEKAQDTVMAERYFTVADDGLQQTWSGCLFVNPPGGIVVEFWQKLMDEYAAGRVKQAVWIGFNLGQLLSLQAANVPQPIQFAMCIPRSRIKFVSGSPETEGADRPVHGNYITYIGPHAKKFAQTFSQFGVVRT